MSDDQSIRRDRKPQSTVPITEVMSCYIDPEGNGGIATDGDVVKPHLVKLVNTFAELNSITRKTADHRLRYHKAVTDAQTTEGRGPGTTKIHLCEDREVFRRRANGGSSFLVVSEQEPTLCFTKDAHKRRAASLLLEQGPRDGKSFGKSELIKHLAAARFLKDSKQRRKLLTLQRQPGRKSVPTAPGPSEPKSLPQSSQAGDSDHAKGATVAIYSESPKEWDPLTNDDLQSTTLPVKKNRFLLNQNPETGKIGAYSNDAIDAPRCKSFLQACATLNYPDTTPTDRKSGFATMLADETFKMPSAWGYSVVKNQDDWGVIRERPEYFPLLSGPDLTTAHWKDEVAYEDDPPTLSIAIRPGKGEREGTDLFEVLSNHDIPTGSTIRDLAGTYRRLNEERPEDFLKQMHEAHEIATTADDGFGNGTTILMEMNNDRQRDRRASRYFFEVISSKHPDQMSLTRDQAAKLRSTSSFDAARTFREQ
jgi:hypothetical protein